MICWIMAFVVFRIDVRYEGVLGEDYDRGPNCMICSDIMNETL